jgi:arginine decarboxylase
MVAMEIEILKASGHARTPLAAFDIALSKIGLHDANLITLSSVIPAATTVVRRASTAHKHAIGDRLYCVLACHMTPPRHPAAAGLAWCQSEDGSGVFIESHGASDDEVADELEVGLADMLKCRPERAWEQPEFEIATEGPSDCATSVVTVAVYDSEDWS